MRRLFILLVFLVCGRVASFRNHAKTYNEEYYDDPEYEYYPDENEVTDGDDDDYGTEEEFENGETEFYSLYREYQSGFSKYFYEYCKDYVRSHPEGRYIDYARVYLDTFKEQYQREFQSPGNVFYSLYYKYQSRFSKYFYEYCKTYMKNHPNGRYIVFAKVYLKTFRNQYHQAYVYNKYQPSGFVTTNAFYALYNKYHSRFSKYFFEYCVNYMKTHPTGRYVVFAKVYVNTFKKKYMQQHSFVHRTYYGGDGGNAFYTLYHKYHSRFSKYFYEYCKNYMINHPNGRYIIFARVYVKLFKNQYIRQMVQTSYGPSANAFYALYNKYQSRFSKYFYEYCKNYISKHPSGQYLAFAKVYVKTFKKRFDQVSSNGLAIDLISLQQPHVGNDPFFLLYLKYQSKFSKFFYYYCSKYINDHPNGKYSLFAKAYIKLFSDEYNKLNMYCDDDNFNGLYSKYKSKYSKFFYNYCKNYVRNYPKGRFVIFARGYLASFKDYHNPPQNGGGIKFYNLYMKYHRKYSKYFYEYCDSYVKSYPEGQYVIFAQGYVNRFRKQYNREQQVYSAKKFYSLYSKYHAQYSKYFYTYCENYLKINPKGKFVAFAKGYINKYQHGENNYLPRHRLNYIQRELYTSRRHLYKKNEPLAIDQVGRYGRQKVTSRRNNYSLPSRIRNTRGRKFWK